ncbi:Calx-beta domain-containing protein [Paenibacillus chartarius]|uniref:Calx-beta domain-containing protein n=1 Tax=Paenibacillus chartarius TaxID=747481 RepID=A0ABV6DU85_9BACL
MKSLLFTKPRHRIKMVLASTLAVLLFIGGQSEVQAESAGQVQLDQLEYSAAESDGFVSITLSRMYGSSGTVSVPYYLSGGTAAAGVDYNSASGEIIFYEGDTFAVLQVPVYDDQEIEEDEGFGIMLGFPSGGGELGYNTTAGVTIYDDDTPKLPKPGTIAFSHYVAGVGEGEGYRALTVNRIDGSDGEVSVAYATKNGTALNADDFETSYGTITFANGETSKSINVTVYDDTLLEDDEYFQVELSQPTNGAVLGENKAIDVIIYDNDQFIPEPPGEFEIQQSYAPIEEGNTIYANVFRRLGTSGTVTVPYQINNGSAVAGADFTGTNGELIFEDGETVKQIEIPVIDDSVYEGNEDFTIALGTPSGGATLGTLNKLKVTINDNDQPSVLQFGDKYYSIEEGDGAINIYVNRIGDSKGRTTVQYTTENGTAVMGYDYIGSSGEVVFEDGETSKSISLDIINDIRRETNEKFTVQLLNPSFNAVVGSYGTASIMILDDEPPLGKPIPRSKPGSIEIE